MIDSVAGIITLREGINQLLIATDEAYP